MSPLLLTDTTNVARRARSAVKPLADTDGRTRKRPGSLTHHRGRARRSLSPHRSIHGQRREATVGDVRTHTMERAQRLNPIGVETVHRYVLFGARQQVVSLTKGLACRDSIRTVIDAVANGLKFGELVGQPSPAASHAIVPAVPRHELADGEQTRDGRRDERQASR